MQQPLHASLAARLGERAKTIRQMRGLTQKGLAARLVGRVDYSYIGKIERGEQLPSLKVLQRIAAALQVPLGYFFSDEAWTALLPEEIRRFRRDEAQAILLREAIHLHPDDIPLVREILRVLIRWRHQVRAGRGQAVRSSRGGTPPPYRLPQVAEGRPSYVRAARQAARRDALQAIGETVRFLSGIEGMGDVRRRLEGVLRELRGQRPTRQKGSGSADG